MCSNILAALSKSGMAIAVPAVPVAVALIATTKVLLCTYVPYSASVTVENFDEFDEWLAIRQSFPYKPLSLNVSSLKTTINLSKFYSSNDSFVKVSPIKLLRYTVHT